MDKDNAIEVTSVSKSFRINAGPTSLKDMIVYRKAHSKKYHPKRKVLDDVSFNVKKGEVIGIIGRNGSGKSTMLKLLSGILRPDTGSIDVDGKISCLIELGAGFHPDMTGRENVYINSSIFGVDKKTTEERFQQILDFSEIGGYIDERVRNYSSGMYLRLAFSVAINVDADILLIDEILAVGDINFSKKCLDKLRDLKAHGVSIVIVTHAVDMAKEMCDRVIWIEGGQIKAEGDPEEVCNQYVEFMGV